MEDEEDDARIGSVSPPKGRSIKAAATIIGVGRTKVYDLIEDGRLKTIKIGRRRLVLADSIDALMRPAP